MDETRQQYRVALAKQLRVGLEENRQIDLRDSGHEVVVAFSDELISPVWHELAVKNARAVHPLWPHRIRDWPTDNGVVDRGKPRVGHRRSFY